MASPATSVPVVVHHNSPASDEEQMNNASGTTFGNAPVDVKQPGLLWAVYRKNLTLGWYRKRLRTLIISVCLYYYFYTIV